MAHAQHVARAIYEAGSLDAFVTSFVWRDDSLLGSFVQRLPSSWASRICAQLNRRSITEVPPHLVHAYPFGEIMRTAALKIAKSQILADLLWDRSNRAFDALVAEKYVPRTQAIHCFEYTALAAFEKARTMGVARILHLPSLDSREFEDIQRQEKERWPELRGPYDGYFAEKFEIRYERRCREIALADVVIANSSLTARSHVKAGAESRKVFAVPLAAPEPIEWSDRLIRTNNAPLRALWAGPFSLRKGAHYLLEAWTKLQAAGAAQLDVYGQVNLPERLNCGQIEGIVFHGSIPRHQLFKAYEQADILIFPTLSDGFGMVVSEAMAHALPVITTDQAGAADLVTPDNGLIVPAADPGAIVDALRWCLDNRSRLAEMRYHALETARRHQWSDFRHELIQAINIGIERAGYKPAYEQSP